MLPWTPLFLNPGSALGQQVRVGELQTEKFDGCERQLWKALSLECVAVYDGNSAGATRVTWYVLEGVARRRQFRNDSFVSGLLEPRLGDGQHVPFVVDDVLVYCERLISDRSCTDQCHVGGTLLTIVGNGL